MSYYDLCHISCRHLRKWPLSASGVCSCVRGKLCHRAVHFLYHGLCRDALAKAKYLSTPLRGSRPRRQPNGAVQCDPKQSILNFFRLQHGLLRVSPSQGRFEVVAVPQCALAKAKYLSTSLRGSRPRRQPNGAMQCDPKQSILNFFRLENRLLRVSPSQGRFEVVAVPRCAGKSKIPINVIARVTPETPAE